MTWGLFEKSVIILEVNVSMLKKRQRLGLKKRIFKMQNNLSRRLTETRSSFRYDSFFQNTTQARSWAKCEDNDGLRSYTALLSKRKVVIRARGAKVMIKHHANFASIWRVYNICTRFYFRMLHVNISVDCVKLDFKTRHIIQLTGNKTSILM